MIATRIFKFDSEIAEIIEVKVVILLLQSPKIILMLQVPTLTSIISAISESNLKILVAFI